MMNDSQNIAFVPSLRLTHVSTCTHCLPYDWLTWNLYTLPSTRLAYTNTCTHCLPYDWLTWTHDILPSSWLIHMNTLPSLQLIHRNASYIALL